MSMLDSGSYSHAFSSEHKALGRITHGRVLQETLRSTKTGDSKPTGKVLIVDKVTLEVMSRSCKMADFRCEGVSLVEDLNSPRKPLPSMDAIYFIQPLRENVDRFLSDMSGRVPLYRKAYVFFSSPTPEELVTLIKSRVLSDMSGRVPLCETDYHSLEACKDKVNEKMKSNKDIPCRRPLMEAQQVDNITQGIAVLGLSNRGTTAEVKNIFNGNNNSFVVKEPAKISRTGVSDKENQGGRKRTPAKKK